MNEEPTLLTSMIEVCLKLLPRRVNTALADPLENNLLCTSHRRTSTSDQIDPLESADSSASTLALPLPLARRSRRRD